MVLQELLLEQRDAFGPGSRIPVTSRDQQVLNQEVDIFLSKNFMFFMFFLVEYVFHYLFYFGFVFRLNQSFRFGSWSNLGLLFGLWSNQSSG
jgi:hypothetical protein